MQPHDSNGKRAKESNPNWRRDDAGRAFFAALRVAVEKGIDMGNRPLRVVAEPGKPVDLSANLTGQGGLKA